MDFELQRFNNNAILGARIPRTTTIQQRHYQYKIICGHYRTVILYPNGDVRACGQVYTTTQNSSNYAYAFGEFSYERPIFSRIANPGNVVDIACTTIATYFLSENGFVTVMGGTPSLNTNYIGLGDTQVATVPEIIPSLNNVVRMSAQETHCAFLTAGGDVYLVNHLAAYKNPYKIKGGGDIVDIFTIGTAGVYGITTKGTVKYFSINPFPYNTGLGQTTDVDKTYHSQFITVPDLDNIVKITGHNNHIFFLSSDGSLYHLGTANASYPNVAKTSSVQKYDPGISDIVDIAYGNTLCMILTKDGSLYTVGAAYFSGFSAAKTTPTLLDTGVSMIGNLQYNPTYNPSGVYMKAPGVFHGFGYCGALGLQTSPISSSDKTAATRLPFKKEVGCISYCGSIILDEAGNPYYLGSNSESQYGSGIEDSPEPNNTVRIPISGIVKTCAINWSTSAGSTYITYFFLKNDGTVYFTGYTGFTTTAYYTTYRDKIYRMTTLSNIVDIEASAFPAQVMFFIDNEGNLWYVCQSSSYWKYSIVTATCTLKVPTKATKVQYALKVACCGNLPYEVMWIADNGLAQTDKTQGYAIDISADSQIFYILREGRYVEYYHNSTTTANPDDMLYAQIDKGMAISLDNDLYQIADTVLRAQNVAGVAVVAIANNETHDYITEQMNGFCFRTSTVNTVVAPYKKGQMTNAPLFFNRVPQQLGFSHGGGTITLTTLDGNLLYLRMGTYISNLSTAHTKFMVGGNYVPEDYYRIVTSAASGTTSIAGVGATYYLTREGDVYYSGPAYWGKTSAQTIVDMIMELSDIADISAGPGGAHFLNIYGDIFSVTPVAASSAYIIGSSTRPNVPTINNDLQHVLRIFFTSQRSFAVTAEGKVFAAGNGKYCSLGTGDTTNLTTFTELTDPNAEDIVKVAGSYYHTVFLNKEGELYSCGYNANARTGVGTTSGTTTTLTKISGDTVFVDVTCNYYGTYALDKDGYVWVCGSNAYNGLAATSGTTNTLTKIPLDVRFREIRATWQGWIGISENNIVYSCGVAAYNGSNVARSGLPQILSEYQAHPCIVSYNNSYIRERCQEMYETLPADLKAVISSTKYVYTASGDGTEDGGLATLSDPVWIQSLKELGITTGPQAENNHCATYSNYTSNATRIGKKQDGETATVYWTRSIVPKDLRKAYGINTSGSIGSYSGNYNYGLRYCFSIT